MRYAAAEKHEEERKRGNLSKNLSVGRIMHRIWNRHPSDIEDPWRYLTVNVRGIFDSASPPSQEDDTHCPGQRLLSRALRDSQHFVDDLRPCQL